MNQNYLRIVIINLINCHVSIILFSNHNLLFSWCFSNFSLIYSVLWLITVATRKENSTVPNTNQHLINCFTGNVNRTAKMFEKKDAPTGSAKEKSCDYISMPVHSTKDHNEKFKKTFAFWNKWLMRFNFVNNIFLD